MLTYTDYYKNAEGSFGVSEHCSICTRQWGSYNIKCPDKPTSYDTLSKCVSARIHLI